MPTTISLTPNKEESYILIDIDHTPESVAYYTVEASHDNGVNWFIVHFADVLSPTVNNEASIQDYEAFANQPTVYRARAFNSNGTPIDDWSEFQSATLPVDRWRLKDLLSPDDNMEIDLTGDYLELSETEDKGRFRPLGRIYPIISADIVRAASIEELNIETVGLDQFHKFMLLRSRQRTLLLQGPIGEQWYIRLGESLTIRIMNTETDYRRLSISTDPQPRPTNA